MQPPSGFSAKENKVATNGAAGGFSFAQILSGIRAHDIDVRSDARTSSSDRGIPERKQETAMDAQESVAAGLGPLGSGLSQGADGTAATGGISETNGSPADGLNSVLGAGNQQKEIPFFKTSFMATAEKDTVFSLLTRPSAPATSGELEVWRSAARRGSADAEALAKGIAGLITNVGASRGAKTPKLSGQADVVTQVTPDLVSLMTQIDGSQTAVGVSEGQRLLPATAAAVSDRGGVNRMGVSVLVGPGRNVSVAQGDLAFSLRVSNNTADVSTKPLVNTLPVNALPVNGQVDANGEFQRGSDLSGVAEPNSQNASINSMNSGFAATANPQAKALSHLMGEAVGTSAVSGASSSSTSSENQDSAGLAHQTNENLDLVDRRARADSSNTVEASLVAEAGASRSDGIHSDGIRSDGLLDVGPWIAGPAKTENSVSQPSAASGAATVNELMPDKEISSGGEPLRSVHVQFSQGAAQHVDLRLVERGGMLSVSVRSNDEALTRSLQDNLPELNTRLSNQHFQTETWIPERSASPLMESGAHDGSGRETGSGSHDSGASGSGNGRQGSGARSEGGDGSASDQSQSGRRDRPAWVRQLAALDAGPSARFSLGL